MIRASSPKLPKKQKTSSPALVVSRHGDVLFLFERVLSYVFKISVYCQFHLCIKKLHLENSIQKQCVTNFHIPVTLDNPQTGSNLDWNYSENW